MKHTTASKISEWLPILHIIRKERLTHRAKERKAANEIPHAVKLLL